MVSERTEQPTPRKREDARKRGQVAISREVDSALVLLASFMVLRFSGHRITEGFSTMMRDSFADLDRDPLTVDLAAVLGTEMVWRSILLLAPLLLAVVAIGLLSGFAQSGGVFSFEPIKPQFKRLNPLQGFKRIFMSKAALMNLAKSLFKFTVLGGVAGYMLWSRQDEIAALGVGQSLGASIGTLADIGFDLVLWVLLALLGLAVVDFIFQRYDRITQLKMTRQEVKDEHRQAEGDPMVRARFQQMRRSFLARVMQEVQKADVVLVNPTHYAVALKYDAAVSAAPKVVAKGEGFIAQRMREIAEEHGIPVISNPPLTRAIHSAVAVGREITPDLYEAVAEVLAFVYRLRYPQARAVA